MIDTSDEDGAISHDEPPVRSRPLSRGSPRPTQVPPLNLEKAVKLEEPSQAVHSTGATLLPSFGSQDAGYYDMNRDSPRKKQGVNKMRSPTSGFFSDRSDAGSEKELTPDLEMLRRAMREDTRAIVAAGLRHFCSEFKEMLDHHAALGAHGCPSPPSVAGSPLKGLEATPSLCGDDVAPLQVDVSAVPAAREAGQFLTGTASMNMAVKGVPRRWQTCCEGGAQQHPRGRAGEALTRVVQSAGYQLLVGALILGNFVLAVFATNSKVQQAADTESDDIVQSLQLVFLCIFTFELVLNLVGYSLRVWAPFSGESAWHLFDMVVVVLSWVYVGAGTATTFTWLRILRIPRLTALLPLGYTASDLRIFISGVADCAVTMLWCISAVLLAVLLFSIFFVQLLAHHIANGEQLSEGGELMLREQFGSVQLGVLSLLEASTGGSEWKTMYTQISELGDAASAVFLFFVIFFAVTVWGLSAAVFVEKYIRATRPEIAAQRTSRKQIESPAVSQSLTVQVQRE